MEKVHDKYLAYVAFFNQWKKLKKEDRAILEPYLNQLKREWERSFNEARLLTTRRRTG
ncbi:MAG TPA: hypothetical protein VGB71_17290 [Flavisolibacter sp.]